MSSQNLQEWFYVEITLKEKTTGATVTYKLSQRPIIDDPTAYIDILKEINGLGGKVDQYLPAPATGTIILKDVRGSFGFERRFSDLLQRYAIVDQTVKIYAAETEYNDENVTSDFSIIRTAKVARWKSDKSSGEITLSVTSTPIEAKYLTRTIDSINFPNAPLQSLGKTLPVVIGGSQEVPAVRIDADADTSPAWAYCTTLSTTFPSGGVQSYYAKDRLGKYQKVKSPVAGGGPELGHTEIANAVGLNPPGDGYQYIYPFTTPSDAGYVAVVGHVWLNHASATPQTSEFSFFLYEANDTLGSDRVLLAEAKATHTTSGTTHQRLFFGWNRPVVLKANTTYYFGFQRNSGSHTWSKLSGGTSATIYLATPVGQSDGSWIAAATGERYAYALYEAFFYDTPSSAGPATDGLGYGSFEVTQTTDLGYRCDLTTLDFIVAVNGLTDDNVGTITGTPFQLLAQMKQVISALMRQWNGSAWIAGPFDSSENSGTHNTYVVLRGATTGRTTLDQLLKTLCKNTASRLAPVGSTTEKIGLWMWGGTQATSAIFTNENSRILSYEQRGVESIVNAFTFYYDRRLRDLDIVSGSAEGQFRNFAGTLNSYPDKNALTTYLAGISKTLFGVRPLLDVTYDFIADASSAQWLEQFLLATGTMPGDYVELECDFMQYRSLKLLQVVEILSPELPGFFGTSPKAKNPTNNGVEIDIMNGDYWMRADRARAQIESLQMISRRRGSSKLRLGCRLLTNFPRDPT